MKKVVLVKLGGSLITNKSKPFSLKEEVLVDLVGQIKKAWDEGVGVVLGHGSGSFAHVPAEKYRTIKGKINEESVYGCAVVEDAASKLNRIVVEECLKQGLPAISIRPFDFVKVKKERDEVRIENLIMSLENGLVPILYGDVVLDETKGFTIWSTEKVLNEVAVEMVGQGYSVEKLIHCGETDGFLVEGKVFEEINESNLGLVKKYIHKTHGFDVTGGMWHKIEESLESAKKGIETFIVGGNHGGNLYRTMVGGKFVGTRVVVRGS